MPAFLLGLGLGDAHLETDPLDLFALSGFAPLVLLAGVRVATELDGVAGFVAADAGLPGVAAAVGHAPNGLGIGIIMPCCGCFLLDEEGVAGTTSPEP